MKTVEVRRNPVSVATVNVGAIASVSWGDDNPVYSDNGSPVWGGDGCILTGSFRTAFLGGAVEYYLDNPFIFGDTAERRRNKLKEVA